MSNFYEDILVRDPRFRSPDRCPYVELLEPVTRAAVAAIVAAAKAEHGMDLLVFETFRSQIRQEKLFAEHATELEKVGVHGYGLACDIVKSINGQPSWAGDFTFLGPLANRYGLIWGGNWGKPPNPHGFHDMDHVQRCSIADEERLFDGSWYPDEAYSPLIAGNSTLEE